MGQQQAKQSKKRKVDKSCNMKINRAENPIITGDDFNQFISQLKPMEIELLWEELIENEQIQKKFDKIHELKKLLDELEERILDLRHVSNEYEYDFDKFIKQLKNE